MSRYCNLRIISSYIFKIIIEILIPFECWTFKINYWTISFAKLFVRTISNAFTICKIYKELIYLDYLNIKTCERPYYILHKIKIEYTNKWDTSSKYNISLQMCKKKWKQRILRKKCKQKHFHVDKWVNWSLLRKYNK